MRSLKVCTARRLPENQAPDADATAVDLRPDNMRLRPASAAPTAPAPVAVHRDIAFAVVEVARLWPVGQPIKVRFLDGDPAIQQRVAAAAAEWSAHINITFAFGNDPAAPIRITFAGIGESWSLVGTEAIDEPPPAPTMNFGWLNAATSDTALRRVVLHEFGHALGMHHEHQSPVAGIKWDKPAVYAYYAQLSPPWSKRQVDSNLFEVLQPGLTNFSAFDRKSIMLYPISNAFTTDDFSVGWNSDLSETDKQFMAGQYPFRPTEPLPLKVNGARVPAAIGAWGEVDRFAFKVTKAGLHIITTEGPTNVVMGLHGPNDEAALFAFDDDSGKGRNARIVRRLNPGQYWVQVRHFDSMANEGAYDVGVRRPA